jgi:hypothetical protein
MPENVNWIDNEDKMRDKLTISVTKQLKAKLQKKPPKNVELPKLLKDSLQMGKYLVVTIDGHEKEYAD